MAKWLGALLAVASLTSGCRSSAPAAALDSSVVSAADRPRIGDRDPSKFDYIVVGSGAGGGPLAARLAQRGERVLLLEAGQDMGSELDYQVPARHAIATENPDLSWWYWVRHHRDAAIDRADSKWTEKGILYPRGATLGGSTAVNAMVTVLPPRADWDELANLVGDNGFSAASMDRYYDRVREWLGVELPDPGLATRDESILAFVRAAAEVVSGDDLRSMPGAGTVQQLALLSQHDVNVSLRRAETEGLFRLPLATNRGRRNGTRELLLQTVRDQYPLTIRTGTFVTRVTFEGDRATGVAYVSGGRPYRATVGNTPAQPAEGPESEVRAEKEVILAAGTFNTPQILMLSGIGDPGQLALHGLPVVAARPGVGTNLQDRVEIAVVSEFSEPLSLIENCDLPGDPSADACHRDWTQNHGVYQTSGFLATALRRSSSAASTPDLQVFAAPSEVHGYYPGYGLGSVRSKTRISWLILKARTSNRDGTVRLRSADPFDPPVIEFNSFDEADVAHDRDLVAVVNGVKFVRRMISRARNLRAIDPPTEVWPGFAVETDAQISAWVRKEAWGHHASCSAPMGSTDDPNAVVDSQFRVIGVQGLRIVDASVFPRIPGTFIVLPLYMLSERAADVILGGTR